MSEPARKTIGEDTETAPAQGVARSTAGRGEERATLDVGHDVEALMLPELLRITAGRFGKSYTDIVMDLARLSLGPGRLSPEEYFVLRLFDDEALAGADKSEFVGFSASVKIWAKANFNTRHHGILDDKVSFGLLMRGYGLPVTETVALYHPTIALPGLRSLHDGAGLCRFLRHDAPFPIFGKPRNSLQSLGVLSLEGYDAARDELRLGSGERFKVERIVEDIIANYGGGYIFQRSSSPHAAVRALCGDRLATVRIMTVNDEDGADIFRACWKIPAGDNVADNFWRPGNILAELDMETGTVKRAFTGIDINASEIETHPDSGARLVGFRIPNWDRIRQTALGAAAIFSELGLIGWDIAPTDDGCVLVEGNHNPDLMLPQLADRRGVLEPRLKRLLDGAARRARADERELKSAYRRELTAGMRRIMKGFASR